MRCACARSSTILNVGIVVLDKDGRVKFINRAFRCFWRVPDKMVTERSDLRSADAPRPRHDEHTP